jgi:large subunit ribosomal protein L25
VTTVAKADLLQLEVQSRVGVGKQMAKRLRAEGLTPGIIYGLGKDPKPISVQEGNLISILQQAGGKSLIEVVVDGKKAEPVVILEVQREPVTHSIIHVDFKRLDLAKAGEFTVKLEFVGESIGVKDGGRLNVIEDDIEVECLPTDLPDKISADISELAIGDALYVRDLKLPDAIVLKTELNTMVVNIATPVAEEVEEVPVEVAEVAEGEEPPEEGEEKVAEKPEGEAPPSEEKS